MLITPKCLLERIHCGIAIVREERRLSINVRLGSWRFFLLGNPNYSSTFDKPHERFVSFRRPKDDHDIVALPELRKFEPRR